MKNLRNHMNCFGAQTDIINTKSHYNALGFGFWFSLTYFAVFRVASNYRDVMSRRIYRTRALNQIIVFPQVRSTRNCK